jgi:hypothetical protein
MASAVQIGTEIERGARPIHDEVTSETVLGTRSAFEVGARGPMITRPSETVPGAEEMCFPDLPMSDRS